MTNHTNLFINALIFSIGFLFQVNVFAQTPLTANAGSDQHLCVGINTGLDITQIGGQPSALGGVPPYSYSWSFSFLHSSGYPTYGSDFLNDTTLANPTVNNYFEFNYVTDPDLPYLVLTVTDSIGNVSTDSIWITFSTFGMTLGGPQTFYVTQGDSVYCYGNSVFGGIGPLTVNWNPAHGILSYDNQAFWASPDTTTSFTLTVADTVGCIQSGPENDVTVVVFPLGIEDGISNNKIIIYPNPATDGITLLMPFKDAIQAQVVFYNSLGQQVLTQNVNAANGEMNVNISSLTKGVYFSKIITNSNTYVYSFVKE